MLILTGMIPGDYVDENGVRIGTDGDKDTKLYFVVSGAEQETIRENEKAKQPTLHSAISSELELPDENVRTVIGVDAVKQAKDLGGFRETGGQVIKTQDGQLAVPALPGPVGTPGEGGGASIDKSKAANPDQMKSASSSLLETTYHVHPGGTKTVAPGSASATVKKFNQQPSPEDINNAANTPTRLGYHLQVGAGSSTINYMGQSRDNPGGQKVNFYNGNGIIGTMSLKGFINAGRKRR